MAHAEIAGDGLTIAWPNGLLATEHGIALGKLRKFGHNFAQVGQTLNRAKSLKCLARQPVHCEPVSARAFPC
jgi:hypothetical protein